jgi:hypothetical protein
MRGGGKAVIFNPQRLMHLRSIAWLLVNAVFLVAIVSSPAMGVAGVCLPQSVSSALAADAVVPHSGPSPIHGYLDGSGSMAGYIAGSTSDVRPLGDLIEIVNQTAVSRGSSAQFFAFGARIAVIPGGPAGAARYATMAAYTCKGCDNKESHIDAVLRQIALGNPNLLNVVVTDFWLDNKSFAGSPQVALGGPLTNLLKQGRSIGVLGLRAPFKGRIYDFPKGGPYADATERPLFVLLIGPASDVAAMYAALVESNSPAFRSDLRRYSVFSTQIGNAWVSARTLAPVGGGVSRSAVIPPEWLQGVQQFVLHLDTARVQHGRVEGVFDASAGVRNNAVWSGALKASTQVWRLSNRGALRACPRNAWVEIAPLSGAWFPAGRATARFTLSPKTGSGLIPGGAYLVAGFLGVRRLQVPNPADAWMRDWSFSAVDEQSVRARHPRFFPTLNLADLATSMEAALDRAAPNGVDTAAVRFVVSVDR